MSDSKKDRIKRARRRALFIAPITIVFWFVMIKFVFLGKGCSSTEGTLVSKGPPLGDWTFKPDRCKSGQREQFFGAFVLGGKEGGGGQIKLIRDQVKQTWVIQVTKPGAEGARPITIDRSKCKGYGVSLHRTSTTVNDIRLLDGRLTLYCTYPKGSISADIKLESCD